MKPNVTELVHMVSHCLGAGMINSGRALVQNTLSTLAGDRIDQAGSLQQSMDLSDVRVLLNALYQVMNTSPSATTAAASAAATAPVKHSSFLGGLLGHEPKPVAAGARSVDASATAAAYAQSNARRAVSGKHIIVSLGARGLMWCGPARHLTATPAPGASTTPAPAPAYLKDGSCVVNEATQSATIFIPALAVNPADIVHTNGAGDALCAGLLAEIVRKAEAAVEGTGEVSTPAVLLPDMECIQKGLLSAHHWLVSLK